MNTPNPIRNLRAFEPSLTQLRDWRRETADALAQLRRWALVNHLTDDQSAIRMAHLERRLATERLSIAFVAEVSRGKSELINALFFADLGARLLPAGAGHTTMCPAEIFHDPSRPPSIRLLPIGTREEPRALREYIAESSTWKEIALDPDRPETLAEAFEVLCETQVVSSREAHELGLPAADGTRVEIPRWRYALVNFPHPLLTMGLVILDTPGLNALGTEPELTLHRLPEADAIVFVLSVDTGATQTDLDLWREHVEPIEETAGARYVVLNKIDGLRDGLKSESQVFGEIDRQVRATAEALRVPPTSVFALSAKQGLVARIQGDGDAFAKSRLYRLEQALASGLVHTRQVDHVAAVGAEARSLLAESRVLLDSRRGFVEDQLAELSQLQGKNQKLVDTLGRKAADERKRNEEARAALVGVRAVHNRHADELAALLDPNRAREDGLKARTAVFASPFSAGISGAADTYFREIGGRIERAIALIHEVKVMMVTVNRKFAAEYGISPVEVADFATDRFPLELSRLEAACARELKSTRSLLTRGSGRLAALFFDSIALKAIHVFEIADREVRAWMNAFIRPLEAQVSTSQNQANYRIEGMARIRNAETDLLGRLGELQQLHEDLVKLSREWEGQRDRIRALLEVREPSLAPGASG
jgi:hypothetical protein